MRNSNVSISLAALLMLVMFPCITMAEESLLERAMSGAEYSVMTSLIVHRNGKSKYLCATTKYACVGMDRAELGVSLVGGARHKNAAKRLLGLVRYQMDAGLSADYKCYIGANGDGVLLAMKSAVPSALRSQCVSEFDGFLRRVKKEDYEIGVDKICRTESQISRELQDMAEIAKLGLDEDCM
ncbi:Imm57 family immunity protein [Pseudoxanthomonas sp. z9]|uniref:Imm57 family immunity protein n=1 Tax=Pseudoxanthomonas sp. z9 TaxID=2584942 RepID=UPI0015E8D54B|nr:Imm57 family immunity protein [Pseudoxanthomonas sp. z9]